MKPPLSVPPVTSEARKRPLPSLVATLRDLCVDLSTDVQERVVDDLLRDVADDDGHLESAEEEQRDLARHQPASDDPDLADVERRRVRPRRMSASPVCSTRLNA